MKRFACKLLLVVIAACMLISGITSRMTITDTGEVTLENIEALATGEGSTGYCYGTGMILCNGNYVEFKIDLR